MPETEQRTSTTLLLNLEQQSGLMQVELARSQAKLDLLLEDRQRASEHRREIYEEVNEIKRDMIALNQLAATVTTLVIKVEALEAERQRATGMIWLVRGIATLLAGAVGAIVTHFLHSKP